MGSIGTADLIAAFEDEQKTVVFSALSDYLHQALFTDVSLVVGHQRLRAHKVVLASSCKFFRDTFKHQPGNITDFKANDSTEPFETLSFPLL